jgi:predicted DNA-binding protein
MQKPNRNGTSEAIRLPNEVVDFLTTLSAAKGISRHDLIKEICLSYIESEKMRLVLITTGV